MKYLFLKGKSAKNSTAKNWLARFRTGHLSTEDEEHSGRPTQVTIPENVDAIHSLILDNRRMSGKR
jgi:transposase